MKTLKLILSSLIKNDSCIEGGRNQKWFIAVIMFFLSLFISVIPTFSTIMTSQGGSFVASTNYNFDVGITRFAEELSFYDVDMTVQVDANNKHCLIVDTDWWDIVFPEDENHVNDYHHYDSEGDVDLEVFYFDVDSTTFSTYLTNLLNNRSPYYISTTDSSSSDTDKRSTSFLAFGMYNFACYIYQPGTTSAKNSVTGDYSQFEKGYNIKDLGYEDFYEITDPTEYQEYLTSVKTNYQEFFNTGYYSTKMYTLGVQCGLILGINTLLSVFMGLMIFLITRGKNNPYRIISFWECEKIVAWTMVTPALLTLIFGFIFPAYAIMIFIMLMGVRTMWLAMRNLKPYATSAQAGK